MKIKCYNDPKTGRLIQGVGNINTPEGVEVFEINPEDFPDEKTYPDGFSLIAGTVILDVNKAKGSHLKILEKRAMDKAKELVPEFIIAQLNNDTPLRNSIGNRIRRLTNIASELSVDSVVTIEELKNKWDDVELGNNPFV